MFPFVFYHIHRTKAVSSRRHGYEEIDDIAGESRAKFEELGVKSGHANRIMRALEKLQQPPPSEVRRKLLGPPQSYRTRITFATSVSPQIPAPAAPHNEIEGGVPLAESAPSTNTCPECAALIPPRAKFCLECGHRFPA